MPLYNVLGSALVSQDELQTRIRNKNPEFTKFSKAIASAQRGEEVAGEFEFSTGKVSVREFFSTVGPDATVPGKDVGMGLPAQVILRHVYTGRLPHDSWLPGTARKDMLLTSAVRDVITTFNTAPRAVNLLKRRVPPYTNVIGPEPTEQGALLVYYSPAVTMQSTSIGFDLAFDDFPDELVSKIGSTVSAAGSIPVFGPYSGVLIAVGAAIKLASSLANALVDARPDFSVSESLEFEIPDSPVPTRGFKILASPSFDHTAFDFQLRKGLVHKDSGAVYSGDEPYIVILLDGTKNEAYEKFVPTAASAALLSRFLSQEEGSEVLLDTVVDAMKLYNDYKFRSEADKLKPQFEALPPGPDRDAVEKKYKALVANILTDFLKPPR